MFPGLTSIAAGQLAQAGLLADASPPSPSAEASSKTTEAKPSRASRLRSFTGRALHLSGSVLLVGVGGTLGYMLYSQGRDDFLKKHAPGLVDRQEAKTLMDVSLFSAVTAGIETLFRGGNPIGNFAARCGGILRGIGYFTLIHEPTTWAIHGVAKVTDSPSLEKNTDLNEIISSVITLTTVGTFYLVRWWRHRGAERAAVAAAETGAAVMVERQVARQAERSLAKRAGSWILGTFAAAAAEVIALDMVLGGTIELGDFAYEASLDSTELQHKRFMKFVAKDFQKQLVEKNFGYHAGSVKKVQNLTDDWISSFARAYSWTEDHTIGLPFQGEVEKLHQAHATKILKANQTSREEILQKIAQTLLANDLTMAQQSNGQWAMVRQAPADPEQTVLDSKNKINGEALQTVLSAVYQAYAGKEVLNNLYQAQRLAATDPFNHPEVKKLTKYVKADGSFDQDHLGAVAAQVYEGVFYELEQLKLERKELLLNKNNPQVLEWVETRFGSKGYEGNLSSYALPLYNDQIKYYGKVKEALYIEVKEDGKYLPQLKTYRQKQQEFKDFLSLTHQAEAVEETFTSISKGINSLFTPLPIGLAKEETLAYTLPS